MPDINRSLIDWPTETPPYDSLEAAVQGETARWNAVGLAAGTVRNGERKIAVSGFANARAGYPLVNDSLFMIGSISKIYTATLVMRLMEQGVFDLDTPVINYVPEFRLAHEGLAETITIRMLLSIHPASMAIGLLRMVAATIPTTRRLPSSPRWSSGFSREAFIRTTMPGSTWLGTSFRNSPARPTKPISWRRSSRRSV